jgi:integrase
MLSSKIRVFFVRGCRMQVRITLAALRQIEPGKRVTDTELQGFCAKRTKDGASFSFRYPSPTRPGHHRSITIGSHPQITPDIARGIARQHAASVAGGQDPLDQRIENQAAVAARDARPTVEAAFSINCTDPKFSGLRTAAERTRFFRNWILPALGQQHMAELSRRQIAGFLDDVRSKGGVFVAQKAYAFLSAFFGWYEVRDETFRSPMVSGLAPMSPRKYARERVLGPAELRDLGAALDGTEPTYAAIVRVLLFTGAREGEIAKLRWREIEPDRIVIPRQRAKADRTQEIPITDTVRNELAKRRPQTGRPKPDHHVFSTTGGMAPFSGFSKAKRRLDDRINALRKARGDEPMPHWTIHDLRRTARTVMSGAGVPTDVAERVLGHAIQGVRSVYDRHDYFSQKLQALQALERALLSLMMPGQSTKRPKPEARRGSKAAPLKRGTPSP